LSPLEHAAMTSLWRRKSATAEQVRDDLLAAGRPLKDSSVRTVLRRLAAKGYVAHSLEGRTFVHRAVEAPQNLAIRAVREIVERLCGGSGERLLLGMVDHRVVDPAELEKVAKLVRRRLRERQAENRRARK
jgi:predicted transcriptional regulator